MSAQSAADVYDAGPRPVLMVAVAVLLGLVLGGGGWLALRATSAPAAAPGSAPSPEAAAPAPPDPLAATLARADEHFDANRFDMALDQYMAVLRARPDHPAALARAGWIAFEGGDDALAERLLQRSLDVAPDNPEALWYLAQVRVHGTGDTQGATVVLRALLARDDLSPSLRAQAEDLLTDARG
jgi:predicted Zn-dependent protease